ncbi:MAG: radical SAM family heme chaperone HemW [SAR202 cluster bacterium]|nr:radical SAM family heme chaperone HemW [SAR202 cluster bacterium]
MDLSLYIHIPFCQTKCPYCDFNTYTKIEHLMPSYIDALCNELILWSSVLKSYPVRTIFLGGGTPSYIPVGHLKTILDLVKTKFQCDISEITIEVNPNDIEETNVQRFLDVGINRVSIGVQSFKDSILKTLGRTHSANTAINTYKKLRKMGFNNISLDLMYGIPYQTLKDWKDSLKIISDLEPDHLSLYCLTLEKHTPMQRMMDIGNLENPDDDLAADMYLLCEEYLHDNGYEQYEISNWSKPHKESQHNLRYWMNQPFLGVGPGAHSYLFKNRFNNIKSPNTYISKYLTQRELVYDFDYLEDGERLLAQIPSLESVEPIDKQLEMGETMMLGLRLIRGIDVVEFEKRFGVHIEDVFGEAINNLIQEKLLYPTCGKYKLTPKGRLLGNEVFSRFF